VRNNPNMQRLNRGNLPASQQVHMGRSLAVPAPTPTASPVVSGPRTAPADATQKVQAEKLRKLEEEVASLTKELSQARAVLQQIGPPTASPDALLQNLKTKAEAFEEQQVQLLQQTALAETLAKKVNDLEELMAEAPKPLDTAKPLDRVYVTTIQSRTNDNGNVVVACEMRLDQESVAVTGTLVIPQSEFGKLRPPKQP
jgi:hypothetical protein